MTLQPLPASTPIGTPVRIADPSRLRLVRTGDGPEAGERQEIPVWRLQVGDVFSAAHRAPDGPMRVDFIAVLPGMRKLFLGNPAQPAPPGRPSAADLRLLPQCTLGVDVLVTLAGHPAPDIEVS